MAKNNEPRSNPNKSSGQSHHKVVSWLIVAIIGLSFAGGVVGGLLGLTVLSNLTPLLGLDKRAVVLQESSVIVDVVNQVAPSVVSITVEGQPISVFGLSQSESSAGTGVIINSDGLVLTNKHLLPDNPRNIVVTTSDGRQYTDVKVLARDPFNDLAYLKIEGQDLTPAELGDSDQVVVGQKVIAIGNALGEFQNTVTSGIVSGIGRPVLASNGISEAEQLADLFQTDAAINPGNSGGPLVNIEGQVIGLNTAVAGGAENIGFAIPINQAKAGIASIEQHGRLIKPYLGVRYVPLTPEFAREQGLPVSRGAYVIGSGSAPAIIPGSPAEQAGIQPRDIIIEVNEQAITERVSLVSLINRYQVGDTVKVTIVRGDSTFTLDVTLEELPNNL